MSSESEDTFLTIATQNQRNKAVSRWSQKAKDKGTGNADLTSMHSQETRWTVSTLKIQSMVIRNEVTYRSLSVRSITE